MKINKLYFFKSKLCFLKQSSKVTNVKHVTPIYFLIVTVRVTGVGFVECPKEVKEMIICRNRVLEMVG